MIQGEFPKVSAFVATYQHAEFIRESLDSVLSQGYPNIELVVGDDGSTDGTRAILEEYRAKYPDIVKLVLAEKNTGITANCNRIFRECTGTYIAFLSGDDVWLPDKLKTQVAFMEAHPECSICYHNLEVFDSATGEVLRYFNGPWSPPHEGGAGTAIQYGTFNGAISNMVRRSACPPHGFDPSIHFVSDWVFWVETLMGGGEICYIDKVLGKYRRHPGNVTRKEMSTYLDLRNAADLLASRYPNFQKEVSYRKIDIYYHLAKLEGRWFSWMKYRLRQILNHGNKILRARCQSVLTHFQGD